MYTKCQSKMHQINSNWLNHHFDSEKPGLNYARVSEKIKLEIYNLSEYILCCKFQILSKMWRLFEDTYVYCTIVKKVAFFSTMC